MSEIRRTKELFLRGMSLIYGTAFASLLLQIDGLFGNSGILPAKLVLSEVPESWKDFASQPTFLRFMPLLGLDVQTSMKLLCAAGVVLALFSFGWCRMRNSVAYFLLWSFYLSLFHVGQTFLWFQWDILLLESGFLTIFLAPFPFGDFSYQLQNCDKITFWLVRWLLFRLMFASGVVKLTSACPTWWGLTALNYHYETQCLPQPLAWYFHQLPEWFHRLSVALTFIIETFVPFLFFSPFSGHRMFAALMQVLLMVMIILTGNYNFFNWLTIVLCLSLLNDDLLSEWLGSSKHKVRTEFCWMTKLRWISHFFIGFILVCVGRYLFTIRFNISHYEIDSQIAFSFKDFERFLSVTVPVTILIGALSLFCQIITVLKSSLAEERGFVRKLANAFYCLVVGICALLMFSISLVPYTRIEPSVQSKLPVQLRRWNQMTASSLRLTSSYGLFRRMTGVNGRPEVIIEGSNFLDGDWKEYEFLYKPGNISIRPSVVAPHQPRLDWQMWFAALSTYERQPWFLNFVYRLLTNQPDVLKLMKVNPFEEAAPKYIRANLFHYHFTSVNASSVRFSDQNWWTRKYICSYLPPLSRSHPEMMKVEMQLKVNEDEHFHDVIDYLPLALLRSTPDGFLFCLAFVASSLTVVLTPFLMKSFHRHLLRCAGVLFIVVGSWAYHEKHKFTTNSSDDKPNHVELFDLIFDLTLLVIILGCIIFIIGFAGCIGALRENVCLLKFFCYTLGAVLFIELVLAVLAFVFTHEIKAKVTEVFEEQLIVRYRDDDDLRNLIDWAQKTFQCCGIGSLGYRDWSANPYFNCTDDNPSMERCGVPYSCCKQPNDIEEEIVNTECGHKKQDLPRSKAESSIYTSGCVHEVLYTAKQNLYVIGGVVLGVAVIQILGIFLARSLASQI